jgi:hypothetical protein
MRIATEWSKETSTQIFKLTWPQTRSGHRIITKENNKSPLEKFTSILASKNFSRKVLRNVSL